MIHNLISTKILEALAFPAVYGGSGWVTSDTLSAQDSCMYPYTSLVCNVLYVHIHAPVPWYQVQYNNTIYIISLTI
jgi:hypothetical protein